MAKSITIFFITVFSLISFTAQAKIMTCPDPTVMWENKTIPPQPWEWNPFADHNVTLSKNDTLYKAETLVAGYSGLGVLCYYKTSIGNKVYSLWWQVPGVQPYGNKWLSIPTGYSCQDEIQECTFNAVIP
ncbi:hypothetical protein BN59_03171 [Legionella massiliensis]|uniref:DUF3757 domain-containing protein n=1 Tax=Legionella massiliensis TaxID=1034943 RepID=A0A078L109_9GAMM|nr:hypothetical protein [Legionella massiliensis]CDZ78856.1 hypothetical protein BN59_03171 [Legionella massiliensis]CEE14594.1 hypothetical protein BN1094_03171 [Legionella massiliensis]